MQQLTQKMKNGETVVQEVPAPLLQPDMVLVRNHFSVISAGTEGATANSARKGLIAKAKERPQQVKQVLEVLKKQGITQTYRAVTKKLEAYSPCGYSSAGEVIAVGSRVTGFIVGDRVACAGVGYANHAEIVAVPVNLCVKLRHDADLADAAYNTLGSIAMQGVRQAGLTLGENALVIGLGLIGQITCQLLAASGVRVFGVDHSAAAVASAKRFAEATAERNAPGVEQSIIDFSNGEGVDAVIITAGTSSLDPINFAGVTARRRGTVVVVGAVPTGFDREHYYRKELSLKMSCSYGPGRYDLDYEEKGADYPYEYVRWTENRNMQAFQELLASGRMDVKTLTTHTFDFTDAPKAYEMIVTRSEPFVGILLKYDVTRNITANRLVPKSANTPEAKLKVAFVGAGSYAQGNLLPNLPRNDSNVELVTVLTNNGTSSKRVAERFGFRGCTDSEDDIFTGDEVNTVFIATRHDSHAPYVKQALECGRNVFVEKPLALSVAELQEVETAFNNSKKQLMVGFNRRFAPLARELKKAVGSVPMSMIYRVNAGMIPKSTWIQDAELGGGRIIGEGCHFIDFMAWMCNSLPVKIYASELPAAHNLHDTVSVNIEFANGSTGVLCYFANGSKAQDKEYLELHAAGSSAVLNDFKTLKIYGKKAMSKKLCAQDKGQKFMMDEFISSLKKGTQLIPFEELYSVHLACFAVLESLKERAPIAILP